MHPATAALQTEAMQRARFCLVFFFFVVLPAYPVQATRIPAWDDSMSEGCSLAPDISLACCIQHDRAYYYGGSAEERTQADAIFRECLVAEGWSILGWVYYAAVRVGGHPLIPLWFRWGFGLPYAWGRYAEQPAGHL